MNHPKQTLYKVLKNVSIGDSLYVHIKDLEPNICYHLWGTQGGVHQLWYIVYIDVYPHSGHLQVVITFELELQKITQDR